MAQIVLTIPDAAMPRVVDALCAKGMWKESDGPRPAFAKKVLVDMLKDITFNYEQNRNRQQAVETAPVPTMVDVT